MQFLLKTQDWLSDKLDRIEERIIPKIRKTPDGQIQLPKQVGGGLVSLDEFKEMMRVMYFSQPDFNCVIRKINLGWIDFGEFIEMRDRAEKNLMRQRFRDFGISHNHH